MASTENQVLDEFMRPAGKLARQWSVDVVVVFLAVVVAVTDVGVVFGSCCSVCWGE